MWEPILELNCICFSGMLVLFAPTGFLWVILYKVWKSQFHHKTISRDYQIMELLIWLLGVVVVIISSVTLLWGFWSIASVLLR
jgi:hypothetical protein